mmetsp:Transcript_21045/g.33943  ORF Transcript_21045/g.33943 Transcript_21045/m.33943 type:complete len:538 (+) Transcript_21045:77-1690(+)
MHKYRLISKKGEGTFSEVLKAQSIKSGKHVAIKCMKNHFDSIDQVNNLREIQALRRLAGHPNIIKLHEVLYDEPTGRLALVFELMDMNLYEAIKGRRHYLPEEKTKQYMYELLKSLDHMHRNGIFHRDVKPENLLLLDDEIKLADLGSCRGIYSRQPYTEYISTRWYRAPEILLTDGYYNFKMDLFAAGCVWFEIVALFPLFPGQTEMDQIQKIHNVLGTPSNELLTKKFKRNASHMDFNFPEKKGRGIETLVPHADPEVVELMKKLIKYDPDERVLARQALKEPYFKDLRDAEKERLAGGGQPLANAVERSDRGARSQKDKMANSSNRSIGGDSDNTPGGKNESRSNSPSREDKDRSNGLPTITHAARVRKPVATQVAYTGVSAVASNREAEVSSEGEQDPDDGTVLPPIVGGIKSKRDSKQKVNTFKSVGQSTLQKSSMSSMHGATQASHHLSGPGSSKGFSGALGVTVGGTSSMSVTGALPSSHAQNWGGSKDSETRVSNRTSAERMNSTWAPNQTNSRKYVSPFNTVSRDKKR